MTIKNTVMAINHNMSQCKNIFIGSNKQITQSALDQTHRSWPTG